MAAPYKYQTAEELRKAAQAYFDWADTHPIRGARTTRKEGTGDNIETSTTDAQLPRPYTYEQLARHLGIVNLHQFFEVNRERGEDFEEVVAWIRNTVRANQVEGGLTGLYAHNIVCRLNGISENLNVQNAPAPNLVDIFAKD